MALRVFTTIRRPRFIDALAEVLGIACILAGLGLGASFLVGGSSEYSDLALGSGLILGAILATQARGALSNVLLKPGLFRGRATVGHDGVGVTRLRADVFVSYANIANVRVDRFKRQVVLESKDGGVVGFRVAEPKVVAAEVTRRLELARQRELTRPIPTFDESREHVGRWIGRARQLLSGGFRHGVTTAGHLADLAADPNAEPEQRIGAALALRDAPQPVRMRVCAAAEEAARPDLGEALTQAVEGEIDEELLARALET